MLKSHQRIKADMLKTTVEFTLQDKVVVKHWEKIISYNLVDNKKEVTLCRLVNNEIKVSHYAAWYTMKEEDMLYRQGGHIM